MNKSLRICFLALKFSPLLGGSEIQAEKQARQLIAMGHQVTIVTLKHEKAWADREVDRGLPILRIGGLYNRQGRLRIGRLGHFPIDLSLFQKLWGLRKEFDLIYALELSTLTAAATLVCKLSQKPLIMSIPSTVPEHLTRSSLMADTLTETDFLEVPASVTIDGGVEYLAKTAVGGRTMVNFIRRSEAYYQILGKRSLVYLQSHRFRTEKIEHIPNGVDCELFAPRPELRPDPEQAERDILCVSRLSFPKGIDILLHAWKRMLAHLDEQHSSLKPRLLLAGDGELAPQLEKIVDLLGIKESVKFLGSRTDVVDLLQHAWGFVLPSRWEGMPNALLEAMSCGLPCVATRVSGSEDLITDETNGLLVEAEDALALSQALSRLITDTTLCNQLGQKARETIIQKYQLSAITEQCLTFFRRTLEETNERGKKKGL